MSERSNRVRIKVGKIGWAWTLCAVLLFIAAVNYGSNLLFLLSFSVIGLLPSVLFLGFKNIRNIKVVARSPEPPFAGETLELVFFSRASDHRLHQGLELAGVPQPNLNLGEQTQWDLTIKAQQRGSSPSFELSLESTWPLGLFRFMGTSVEVPDILIFPAVHKGSKVFSDHDWQNAQRLSESSEIDGLRNYQSGDALTRVDWRAMARRDALMVRVFDGGDSQPEHWLNWDDFNVLGYEERISALAYVARRYHYEDACFGFNAPGLKLPPDNGHPHVFKILKHLALMPAEANEASREAE